MNQKVCAVARYEAILLRRSWVFRFFVGISLLVIILLQYGMQGNAGLAWYQVALPASVPWLNAYFFSIAQSFLAIFVVVESTSRGRRSDTMSVLDVRPLSNIGFVIGRIWGAIRVFIAVNLVSILLAMGINIFITLSPFDFWSYLFYFFTYSLPSLVFIVGFAMLISSWIRYQALVIFILLLYLVISCTYLPEIYGGVFDFMAIGIPNLFSSVTGHACLGVYLLHRFAFVMMGVGCIGVVAWLMRRSSDEKEWKGIKVGVLFILTIGIITLLGYLSIFAERRLTRSAYAETYLKYEKKTDLRVEKQNILYRQERNHMRVVSNMIIRNIGKQELSEIVLYLNPKLKITEITSEGKELSFCQENQAIVVNQSIEADQMIDLHISYKGGIDERICYLDIPTDKYENTRWLDPRWRFGKRYVFLESNYTLLTPECLWYPVVVPPVNLRSRYAVGKNFTEFTLRVINPQHRTVISQGEYLEQGDTVCFFPTKKLTGQTLCVGEYKKETIKIDSLLIEAYYIGKEHWDFPILTEAVDSLPAICAAALKNYPFPELRLIEVPVTFATYERDWKGGSEYVQPALLMLPERATTLPDVMFFGEKGGVLKVDKEGISEDESKIMKLKIMFNAFFFKDRVGINKNTLLDFLPFDTEGSYATEFEYAPNPCNIEPMYSYYTSFLYSADYPIIDRVFVQMEKFQADRINVQMQVGMYHGEDEKQQARFYLTNHSLEEALTDKTLLDAVVAQVIEQKSQQLKNEIGMLVSYREVDRFVQEFKANRLFQEVSLLDFNQAFYDRYGCRLEDCFSTWYNQNGIPRLIVRDIEFKILERDDLKGYMGYFRVYNSSARDAIITVATQSRPVHIKNYAIGAKEAKEIRFLSQARVVQIFINTGLSENIPMTIGSVVKLDKGKVTSDSLQGVFTLDSAYFLPKASEIVVDNEDAGFQVEESSKRQGISNALDVKQKRYTSLAEARTNKWVSIIDNNCYGDYIASAYAKLRLGKETNVSWTADILQNGHYELWTYIPYFIPMMIAPEPESIIQYYVIRDGGQEREVSVDVVKNTGWVFLGECMLDKGESKVTLLDKGKSDQRIFADAVKWVRVEQK